MGFVIRVSDAWLCGAGRAETGVPCPGLVMQVQGWRHRAEGDLHLPACPASASLPLFSAQG